jgi:hypothetical protein
MSGSNVKSDKWLEAPWFVLPLVIAIFLVAAAGGGVISWTAWLFAGYEWLMLAGIVGAVFLVYLGVVRFDWMVFGAFICFGVVVIEPAPTDLLVLLLLPVGVITGRLALRNFTQSGERWYLLFLWGFLIVNFLSLINMEGILGGVRFVGITFYLLLFAQFVRLYVREGETAVRWIMTGYLLSGLLSMVLVLFGFMGYGGEQFVRYGLRAQALFKDTNVFGPYLILPILFLVDELRYPQLLRLTALSRLLLIVLFGSGVFLSGSRAAWGNLAISMLIYFALTMRRPGGEISGVVRRRILPRYAIVLLVVFMLAAVFFFNQEMAGFMRQFWAERARFQSYDADRFAHQRAGVMIGLTHLFGLGPGSWGNAHSLYARTFAEHGIFGLFFLLAFIGRVCIRNWRCAWNGPQKVYGLSTAMLFAVTIGHLLNSFVIDTIHWRHFWLILALSAAVGDGATRNDARKGNIGQ